jgi:chaperonin GroEL
MPKTVNPWQTPRVIFDLAAQRGMQRGINQLANAIRPTLGPLPRLVVTTNVQLNHPELLDNGALIARRIVQIRDRQADVGAMYLRNLLWRLHETAGDGTATAAVLFQAIYNTGLRYIVADGNAMRLRQHLEAAAQFALDLLAERTLQIEGRARIARLAETICYDHELSEELGEIFDVIGPYGRLEIRAGHGQRLERQFVEGSYWDGPLLSPHMVNDAIRQRGLLEEPAIFVSNLEVQQPSQLIPLMEAAIDAGARSLLLIVKSLAEPATALLLLPPNRERLLVVAARTPGADTTATRDALHDLALLTGGRPLLQEAGDRLEQARPDHLGRARRAWADAEYFGLVGGQGDPVELRRHVAALRLAYGSADDPRDRTRLLDRIGKLLGGAAMLRIGALSPLAHDLRKEQANRTSEALRGALRDGLLPGGGVALLDCIPALEARRRAAADPDERAAYQILSQAFEAPARALFHNAGFDPSATLAGVRAAGPGHGYDVVRREVVQMAQAGILDSAAVVRAAVGGAIRSAALAFTIATLVHRASPPDSSTNP